MLQVCRGRGDQPLYAPLTEVRAAKQVEELEAGTVLSQLGQSVVLDSGAEAEADIAQEGAGGGELGGGGIIDLVAAIKGDVLELGAAVCEHLDPLTRDQLALINGEVLQVGVVLDQGDQGHVRHTLLALGDVH